MFKDIFFSIFYDGIVRIIICLEVEKWLRNMYILFIGRNIIMLFKVVFLKIIDNVKNFYKMR